MLAGGSGTRLWPVSRKSYPKQFVNFNGDVTLYQQSVMRVCKSDILNFASPLTVTNNEHRFVVADQLQSIGVDPGTILIEPESKNTAPAILAACIFLMKSDPEAVILVSPVDHFMSDRYALHDAVNRGLDVISEGKFVTFGVTPTRPETGYGYLKPISNTTEFPIAISSFVEKPDICAARAMLDEGGYLWNTGIFLFRARDMIKASSFFEPNLLRSVEDAVHNGFADFGFWRLDPEAWLNCDSNSIDYAIMERTKNLMVVQLQAEWSDLGDWHTVWLEKKKLALEGVVTEGNVLAVDCEDVLLRCDSPGQQLVGLGLRDIVAISMSDAVLLAHKDKTQSVKAIVEKLQRKGVRQAEEHPLWQRPWGTFESLIIEKNFHVKRLNVKPFASLSLQSHKYRSEHWIVVEGVANVTVDGSVSQLSKGQSTFVPAGAIHRLENLGSEPIVLIEIQTGSYFGEDDIKRYEDKYSRF